MLLFILSFFFYMGRIRYRTERRIRKSPETRNIIIQLLNENAQSFLKTLAQCGINVSEDKKNFDSEKMLEYLERKHSAILDIGGGVVAHSRMKGNIVEVLLQICSANAYLETGETTYRYFYFVKQNKKGLSKPVTYWYETTPMGIVENELPLI